MNNLATILVTGHIGVLLAILLVWLWRRKRRKQQPEVRTEGTPLKLPRREGNFIRVPYNTEAGGLIELNGERFYVKDVHHDFSPAGCHSYGTLEPVVIPPSRYELLMKDDE